MNAINALWRCSMLTADCSKGGEVGNVSNDFGDVGGVENKEDGARD